jgi:hypothetical protein
VKANQIVGILDPDALLTTAQAAALLNSTEAALHARRHRGGGPMFVRVSPRRIRYRKCDLVRWVEQRLTEPSAGDHPVEVGVEA